MENKANALYFGFSFIGGTAFERPKGPNHGGSFGRDREHASSW